MTKSKVDILELFSERKQNNTYLNIAAPMVRYSKLEFRKLLRKYKTELCFTPMIIADSFCRSEEARNSEFTTSLDDSPLIAQFAVKSDIELQTATELIYPYVDGVDINCGCPQKWAIAKSYGCALLKKPELIQDMIKSIRRSLPNSFSCSVKMRLLQNKDLRTTVDLCQQLEHCGATFLSVHARTPWQKSSEPVNILAVSDIKKSLNIPVIYNGDIKCLNDAETAYKLTSCDGVMSARGLLTNPSLYTGTQHTSIKCLQDWVNIGAAADSNISFQCFHHHLTFMMEKLTRKKTRTIFNCYSKKNEIFDFMKEYYNIEIQKDSDIYQTYNENILKCIYNNNIQKKYESYVSENTGNIRNNRNENSNGKFYLEYKENMENNDIEEDHLSFMGNSIFD